MATVVGTTTVPVAVPIVLGAREVATTRTTARTTILGLVDGQAATTEVRPVQAADRLVRCRSIVVRDETETTGFPGLTVSDQLAIGDDPVLLELGTNLLLRGVEGEVAHIETFRHRIDLS
jgi:hypothetical protein